jgi:uncharacterized membrane protein
MGYSFYQLLWLFFLWSFIGWCAEVVMAAVRRHAFVNRGFVNGPFCPIYGAGAVSFAIFLPGLKDNLFFLFLGGMILASFIEYTTGHVMERFFHRKWWDYSNERFNAGGYICLRYSLIWGLFAVLIVRLFNPLFLSALTHLPALAGWIILWSLTGLFAVDYISSVLTILHLHRQAKRFAEISGDIQKTSRLLENALTRQIQRRMAKAYPALHPETLTAEELARKKPEVFAEGCSFYKLVALFFIGAFLGDVTETIFCRITAGVWMSRSGVVYGPFSLVWGLGCAVLTALLYRYRDKNDRHIFLIGTVLGGAYEYICSVFTELVFGTVFWDYSAVPFNLAGRINLLFCFFWGIAAVIWIKILYPIFSRWIEKLPMRTGKILCHVMIVFMAVDIVISALAFTRYTARYDGEPASGAVDEWMDERFPDERMERIFPNAIIR